MSVNAKTVSTTIVAKDKEVEIAEACQILALLDQGRTLDRMYEETSLLLSCLLHKQRRGFHGVQLCLSILQVLESWPITQ